MTKQIKQTDKLTNMKAKLFKTMLCAGMAGTLLTGCMDNNDVYNPDAVKKQFEQNWKKQFGEIDPNQTWNTATRVTAKVSIDEDALTEYTFKIYTANPLYDKSAMLLAQTSATTDRQGHANVNVTFDAPSTLQTFYVARLDAHNRRVVKSFDCENASVSATFGNIKTDTRASVQGDLPTINAPYTNDQVIKFIEEGYDLANGLEYKSPYTYGEINKITDFNQVAYIDNNKTNTPIAVIKNAFNGNLGTENSRNVYYTKGAKQQFFEWWPENKVIGEAFHQKEESITELGTVKFIIADGGSYTLDGVTIANMDIIVANGGTLMIKKTIQMNDNARIIIMHGGTLIDESQDANNSNPSINHDAKSALIYNNGEIQSLKYLKINSAEFSNDKNGIIIANEISMQNDDGVITNYGKIDVDKVSSKNDNGVDGNQGTLNNGCLFRSKEKINFKYINQAAETAIECEYISFYNLTLRDNSILRTNHLYANNTTISYEGTKDPALISVGNVDYVNHGNFNISGNIYFEANTYSMGEVGDQYDGFWKVIDEAIKKGGAHGISKVGEADVTIIPEYTGDDLAKLDCIGKGNKPTNTPEPGTEPKAQPWILACEDLGNADDFDFNDIVFKVEHVAGSATATVTPLAAGGVLAAKIYYGETLIGEIHEMLGASGFAITNTTSKGNGGASQTIEVSDGFSMTNNMGDFKIKIMGKDGKETEVTTVNAPENGAAPQMICIDGSTNWAWPTERTKISDAYPGFGEWGANYTANPDWYENANDNYIVK